MPYEQLTRQRLTQALRRLSELATAEGIVLDLALYGAPFSPSFTAPVKRRRMWMGSSGHQPPAPA